jgi:XTP/dITP diphosphohydrolase
VDGKNFKIFEGKINGCITNHPKGDRTFQWDCIFIPDGKNMTFAEMGTLEKNKISMRKQALTEFAKYLNEQ